LEHEIDPTNRALWRYYQNDACGTFSLAHPRLAHLKRTAAKLGPRRSLQILNIGGGEGWLEQQCLNSGWRVSALDPDEGAVMSLRTRGVDSKVGTITRIPFEAGRFDVVFCSEVLEHLRDNEIDPAISEINRCLGSRGHLIGTVPYRERVADNTIFCPHCRTSFHKWGHVQSFDESRMRALLAASGFDVILLGPRAFADFSRPEFKNQLKSLIRAILGRLGEPIASPNLFFVARKRT
jgi:SAM-dependent methyltransferase